MDKRHKKGLGIVGGHGDALPHRFTGKTVSALSQSNGVGLGGLSPSVGMNSLSHWSTSFSMVCATTHTMVLPDASCFTSMPLRSKRTGKMWSPSMCWLTGLPGMPVNA